LIALFPKRFHKYINEKGSKVGEKFGAWVRGQITLMAVIGVMIFIALKIAGVNYAATLATLAGFTELIPYVGPIIALIPAVILAASQGGFVLAIIVTAIYIGVQQLEGNLIVPLVMEKAVGLSPVVVMFAMLVGASFPDVINPVVGIIVSVPIATAVSVFVHDWAGKEK
jgi:predicted PurR-regulated permease PerM